VLCSCLLGMCQTDCLKSTGRRVLCSCLLAMCQFGNSILQVRWVARMVGCKDVGLLGWWVESRALNDCLEIEYVLGYPRCGI
jgi:hypothetical protein